MTDLAGSPAITPEGSIEQIERMPTNTMSLRSKLRREAHAPQDVNLTSHYFQMGRIHAGPISTEMVQVFVFGNGASEQFIGNPMSWPSFIVYLKTSVPSDCCRCPHPTAIGSILVNFGPKTGFNGLPPIRVLPSLSEVYSCGHYLCPRTLSQYGLLHLGQIRTSGPFGY